MHTQLFHVLVPPGPIGSGGPVYPAVLPRGPLIAAGRARRAGWNTTVFDAYSFPDTATEFVTSASTVRSAIGVSVHGAPSVEPARAFVDAVRRSRPDVQALIGGNLANVASSLLSLVFADCLVYEGGSSCVVACLEELRAGRQGVFHVPTVEECWDKPDLGALHKPFVSYLADPDFEYHIPTQVGCPFRCFHCGTGRHGLIARVVPRPSESLEEELDWLTTWCADAGVPPPKLWISDETFSSTREHALDVVNVFRARPIFSWRAQTRVDSVDVELVKQMKAAGCHKIAFGVEVPTDSGMRLFGKREAMERAEYAFRIAHEAGLRTEAILVFGAPEDQSTFDHVFDTLAMLDPDTLQSYLYHPVPGSPWWRSFGQAIDLATSDKWTALDFHSPIVTARDNHSERDSLARFLASLAWSGHDVVSATAAGYRDCIRDRLSEGYECPGCSQTVHASRFLTHNNVSVFSILEDHVGEILIAVGSAEIVACRSNVAGNIHQSLLWITDLALNHALTRLCPTCSDALEGAGTLQSPPATTLERHISRRHTWEPPQPADPASGTR